MLQFRELRITPDGSKLIIDISIEDLLPYSNVYLESIMIDTQDTFTPNGPSSNPIYVHNTEETSKLKNIRLTLSITDFLQKIVDLNSNLFFVYAIAKGTPSIDTPCGLDNKIALGVVFNTHLLYNNSMAYFRELESTCSIPRNMVDYILKMKGLEVSLVTNNYIQAIKYWNKFFKTNKYFNIPKCNCYG